MTIDHPHQWWGGRTYAQHGDDLAILNIFHRLSIKQPTYIDAGAHHPEKLSNTALLYKRGSRGINIEANPALIGLFKTQRPDDINVYAAIVPDNRAHATLYRVGLTNGINSTLPQPCADKVEVPAMMLDHVIDKYANGVWPDLLSLDIEGQDAPVLRSINTSRPLPRVICVEAVSQLGDSTDEIGLWALNAGYFTHSWAGNNMLLVRQ